MKHINRIKVYQSVGGAGGCSVLIRRKLCHIAIPKMIIFSQLISVFHAILSPLEAKTVLLGSLSVRDSGHLPQHQVKCSSVQESDKKAAPSHQWNRTHCDPFKVALLSQTVPRLTIASVESAQNLSVDRAAHGRKMLGSSHAASSQCYGTCHWWCIATFYQLSHGRCRVSMWMDSSGAGHLVSDMQRAGWPDLTQWTSRRELLTSVVSVALWSGNRTRFARRGRSSRRRALHRRHRSQDTPLPARALSTYPSQRRAAPSPDRRLPRFHGNKSSIWSCLRDRAGRGKVCALLSCYCHRHF